MDIQYQLHNVLNAISEKNVGHARRLLRNAAKVVSDKVCEASLIRGAVQDLTNGCFKSAADDVKTARIVDERASYSVML